MTKVEIKIYVFVKKCDEFSNYSQSNRLLLRHPVYYRKCIVTVSMVIKYLPSILLKEFHSRSPLNHRRNIDDVILLFTDGEPRAEKKELIKEQYEMANKYSAELMARNVSIVALAVGREANKPEFQENIASWSNIMFISAFDKLDEVLAKIVDESCGVKPGKSLIFILLILCFLSQSLIH